MTYWQWVRMPRVEIINGEMVEMAAAGILHHIVIGNIYYPLETYNRQHEIGTVFMDGLTYLMFSDPSTLKDSFFPDVSFIRNTNTPPDFDITKPHPGAPDLAVEVISPNDKALDVQDKIVAYLEKGTEQSVGRLPGNRQPIVAPVSQRQFDHSHLSGTG